jgi:hypothetical protein
MSLPALRSVLVNGDASDLEAVTLALPGLSSLNGKAVAGSSAAGGSVKSVSTRSNASYMVASSRASAADRGMVSRGGSSGHGGGGDMTVSLATNLSQDDVDGATRLFGILNGLKEGGGRDQAKFDAHYKDVLSEFHALSGDEEDPFVRHGQVLRSKHRLYDMAFAQAIDVASSLFPELGHALNTIRSVHADMVNEVPKLLRGMSACYVRDLSDLQTAVRRSDKETTELLEAAELLEQETQAHLDEKKAMAAEFERERAILMEELQHLQRENDKLHSRLSRVGQAAAGGPGGHNTTAVSSASLGGTGRQGSPTPRSPSRALNSTTTSSSVPHAAPQVRTLTKKQLLEAIEEIYESKVKFDAKCAAAHLPRETLEQHLYSWLNTKYGLKTLIVEWAAAIISAVKRFSEEDNDVAVFGAILRNEIDEEFRHVQKQLKDTVRELLRVYLRSLHPNKTEGEISDVLKKRMAGDLSEEEWVDIVKYMYNQEDATAIAIKIKDLIRTQQLAAPPASPFRIRAPRQVEPAKLVSSIAYDRFLSALLEYQLKGHEAFLLRFGLLFRQVDTDQNGIINEEEARRLINLVSPGLPERSIIEKLNKLDPYNNQQATFSECVAALSSELVKMMKDQL